MTNDLIHDILSDMSVELKDEFDRNFSRGAFFDKRWSAKRDGSASHLQNQGTLRKSIRANIRGSSLVFSSSEPYAAIHNEGGSITVTKKMRGYFWHKYSKAGKKGEKAAFYKAMALKKVGDKIKIPQRQFIGDHPQVRSAIEDIVRENVEARIEQIIKQFKQFK